MRLQARLLVQLSLVIDAVFVALVFGSVWKFHPGDALARILIALLVVPFWVGLLRYFGAYHSQRLDGWVALTRKIASAHFVGLVALSGILGIVGGGGYRALLLFAAISFAGLTAEKCSAHLLLRRMRRRGLDTRNVLVISRRTAADEIQAGFQEHTAWGLRVAMVGDGPCSERFYRTYPEGAAVGGDLEKVLQSHVIDEVVLAIDPDELPEEQITIHICERYGVVARILFGTLYKERASTRAEEFYGSMSFAVGPSRDTGLVVKRIFDVLLSGGLLLLSSPLMLVCAIAVKLSSVGPVIFKQTRVGLRGRRFTMYKFRTMICGAEALLPALASHTVMAGPVYKQFSDPRITAAGRILRKFSLDELPQLWNVLKGEMSLVGPRPLPVRESDAIDGEFRRRFSMRPGLTCFWQVNGRNDVEFTRWMKYDLQYVDRWSLLVDAKLLLRTIPAVLSGRGAY